MLSNANWFSRFALGVAGILGAGGTAAAALASHAGDERVLGAVALVALTHAAAFLAFGLSPLRSRSLRAGGLVIGAGVFLFAADLLLRHILDYGLFPMAAPAGGTMIIAGWTLIAVAGTIGKRD